MMGFGRLAGEEGCSAEFIPFLHIAKGSCGEPRAQLQMAADQRHLGPEEHSDRLVSTDQRHDLKFHCPSAGNGYSGEKANRPQRLVLGLHQRRQKELRAVQLADIHAVKQRNDTHAAERINQDEHP